MPRVKKTPAAPKPPLFAKGDLVAIWGVPSWIDQSYLGCIGRVGNHHVDAYGGNEYPVKVGYAQHAPATTLVLPERSLELIAHDTPHRKGRPKCKKGDRGIMMGLHFHGAHATVTQVFPLGYEVKILGSLPGYEGDIFLFAKEDEFQKLAGRKRKRVAYGKTHS